MEIIGVGIDVENINRFSKLLSSEKLLSRLFYKEEIKYVQESNKPLLSLAGIWCAKEAAFKAIPSCFSCKLQDILIDHDFKGKPIIKIKNLNNINLKLEVSISHTNQFACCMVIALNIKS